MRKVGFLLVVLAAMLFGSAGGCNEEQLRRVDRAVADVNTAAQGVAAIPDGPAGALIPREVVMIMELLGLGAAAAFGIWQRIRASGLLERNADLSTTLKVVVDAIDLTGGEPAEAVKANVLETATTRHVYDTADAVIDEHRASKAGSV
jgi:hypothetical protein